MPNGWAQDVRIEVGSGAIVRIEVGASAQAEDTRAQVGLAGLPNLHSHAFQRGMAGLTEYRGQERDSFWTWRELMYRFLARMTPDDVEAITAQAYVEMLEAGFTRVGEFHYLHRDPNGGHYANPAEMAERVAAAARHTGIALTLLPVFYAHGGFDAAHPLPGQRRFLSGLDDFARLYDASRTIAARLPDGRIGVAPHSLRAVTPEELHELLKLGAGVPVHIHAAEQTREVEECLAWSGLRPVEWLLEHADVDARFCLVHATHLTAAETHRLAASGAVAGLCPVTEANLGDGVFPASEYLKAQGRFGVGTDSNILIAANEELRQIEYAQRLEYRLRNVLSGAAQSVGRTLYDGALAGGAQALGIAPGIRVGAPADLIALDLAQPCFAARSGDALLDSWIFAAGAGAVDAVWRGGEQVVANGRHRDREAVATRYRASLERLLHA